jgi:rod shape determining protein RodA
VIAAAIVVLMVFGLASIWITDTHYAPAHDGPRNAIKQLVVALLGVAAAAGVLRVGYQRVCEHAYLIYTVALVLLLPLVVARVLHSDLGGLTPRRNGAYRWINLPLSPLQPSEFMKLAYILAMSWYLRHRKDHRQLRGLAWPMAMSAVPLGLILLQPDLGTALLIVPVFFTMLFMAGARLRHLGLVALCGVVMTPVAWVTMREYQRLRITAVLLQADGLRQAVIEHPEDYFWLATKRQAIEWSASSGYQLVHAKNALGSGGLLGNGWGDGPYVQHNRLPDRHNDFVFSMIGHQWGFVGCLFVLLAHLAMVAAGLHIASATLDPFGRLLAVGIVVLIASQVLINVAMTVGLLPITGMTLPFVSYGGSSLLASFVAVGLLVSISRHRPFLLSPRPFEFGEPNNSLTPRRGFVGSAVRTNVASAVRTEFVGSAVRTSGLCHCSASNAVS